MRSLSYEDYRKGRRLVSHLVTICIALLLLFINGYFTVEAARIAGTAILANEYTTMQQLWYTLGGVLASAPAMWLAHILFSLIEGNGWRDLRGASAIMFITVIGIDLYTTYIGLSVFVEGMGYTVTGLSQVSIIASAIFLALAPEPIIVDSLQRIGLIDRPRHVSVAR